MAGSTDTENVLVLIEGSPTLAAQARAYGVGSLASFRDWIVTSVIGPHNAQAMEQARRWNVVPQEERLDEDFEALKAQSPEAAQFVEQSGIGPDVGDMTPALIDPQKVDYAAVWTRILGRTPPPDQPGSLDSSTLFPPPDWNKGASWSFRRVADKLHDFLANPASRPDLQTPEGQAWLRYLEEYHNDKTDAMMPWLTREWKKGRIQQGAQVIGEDGPRQGTMTYVVNGDRYALGPGTLGHWADWYHSNHPTRQGTDLMQMKVHNLHDKIREWDEAMMADAGKAAETRGEVVHEFPNGWNVQRLETPEALKHEGQSMGHCVGDYAPYVADAKTLIYSLRDHNNVPHVTTEITPERWHTPYGGLTDMRSSDDNGRWPAAPHYGTIEQIQGQGNTIPKPEYQEMMKNWFSTFPEEERPRWKDAYLEDPRDLEEESGYMPHGDYGVEGSLSYHWPRMFEYGQPNYMGSGDYADEVKKAMKLAIENGEDPKVIRKEFDNYSDEAQKFWNLNGFHFDPAEHGISDEDYYHTPECDCPDPDDCWGHDPEFDAERYDRDLDRARDEARRIEWNGHPLNGYLTNLDYALGRLERQHRAPVTSR